MARGKFTSEENKRTTIFPSGSEEQVAIWGELDSTNRNVIVNALAGSGKTFCGVEWCKRNKLGSTGFVAFNKHIADELKLRLAGSYTDAMTYHSLGFKLIRNEFGGRVRVDQYKVDGILEDMDLKLADEWQAKQAKYRIKHLAGLAKQYCVRNKGELEFLVDHHDLDLNGQDEVVYEYVPKVLDECKRRVATIDFDDMVWLPQELKLQGSKYDTLLIDESQDTNLAQQWLALNSTQRLVVIGDKNQCHPPNSVQIEITGGSKKLIEDIMVGDSVVSYCCHDSSFYGIKYKGKKVLATHSESFDGYLLDVQAGGKECLSTPNHRWLVRLSNDKKQVDKNYILYLMVRDGRARIGICRLRYIGACGLGARARSEKAEKAWILQAYENLNEARVAELVTQCQFGIPSLIFEQRMMKSPSAQPEFIEAVYTGIGNLIHRVKDCLKHFGREWEYPIWEKEGKRSYIGVKSFITETCNIISGFMDVKLFEGDSHSGKWRIASIVKKRYKGMVYGITVEPTEGRALYVANGLVTHNSIYGFRGADSESMSRIRKELSLWENKVVDMPLTVTRRCPVSHVKLAQCIVPEIKWLDKAPEGNVDERTGEQAVNGMGPGDLVVCRVNAELIGVAYKLLKRGVKAVVRGRDIGEGIVKLVDKAVKLGGKAGNGGFGGGAESVNAMLGNAAELTRMEVGKFLSLPFGKGEARASNCQDRMDCLVNLCDEVKTVSELRGVIASLFADFQNDGKPNNAVVMGTVHRTKGLEADRVWILRPDILMHPMAKKAWELDQERNIAYIAVTRSKRELYFVGKMPGIFGDERN
jgi:hypothetical protein